MTIRERVEESNADRRLVLLAVVLLLILVGSGVGTFVFSPPTGPTDGDVTTPTAQPTPTPTPTATSGGSGPPSVTDTPTPTPVETPTPATATPTETPTETPTATPEDDSPVTPSPGLELDDSNTLLYAERLAPGQSGRGTLTLRNAEDEGGNLTISAVENTDDENGLTDPENAVDSTADVGELSSHLEVRVAVRNRAGDETYLFGSESGYVTLSELRSRTPSAGYHLASGEEVTLVADWRLPASTGNVVQSDGITTELGLTLESTDG